MSVQQPWPARLQAFVGNCIGFAEQAYKRGNQTSSASYLKLARAALKDADPMAKAEEQPATNNADGGHTR